MQVLSASSLPQSSLGEWLYPTTGHLTPNLDHPWFLLLLHPLGCFVFQIMSILTHKCPLNSFPTCISSALNSGPLTDLLLLENYFLETPLVESLTCLYHIVQIPYESCRAWPKLAHSLPRDPPAIFPPHPHISPMPLHKLLKMPGLAPLSCLPLSSPLLCHS